MTGPLIEPTDEMKAAFRAAQEQRAAELVAEGAPLGAHDILDRGLTAVFTVLARDYTITPKQTPQVATSCGVCRTDIGLWSPPSLDTGYTHIRPGGGPDWDLNRNHEVAPVDLVPFPPGWAAVPAAAPQCPACTSPYPHHRFVLPVVDPISHAYAGNQRCSDPWHDADAVTSGTYTRDRLGPWPQDAAAVNTDDRCPDEHQPAHGAGTRPEDCGTCAGTR